MALVSTGGSVNIESDVALAAGAALTATRMPVAGREVTIHNITVGCISSTASGATCGYAQLQDGATVLGRWYVMHPLAAVASAHGISQTFPVGAKYRVVTDINLTYTNVANSGTAACSFVWS
jgi:hypothetical protein